MLLTHLRLVLHVFQGDVPYDYLNGKLGEVAHKLLPSGHDKKFVGWKLADRAFTVLL